MYKLITKRENIMGTPASKTAKIKYFEEALAKSAFIEIDGYMFRITGFFRDGTTVEFAGDLELHFEDEESGEMHVNTFAELIEDMHEIKLFELQRCWG